MTFLVSLSSGVIDKVVGLPYIREDLTGDVLLTFDNGVCEVLVVMIHQLNSGSCCIQTT